MGYAVGWFQPEGASIDPIKIGPPLALDFIRIIEYYADGERRTVYDKPLREMYAYVNASSREDACKIILTHWPEACQWRFVNWTSCFC